MISDMRILRWLAVLLAVVALAAAGTASADPNSFNRLLKPPSKGVKHET